MAEHLVVNVEAQVARRIWEEAEGMAKRIAEIRAEQQSANGKDKRRLSLAISKLTLVEEGIRHSARNAVLRSESIPDDTPPERLEPTRRLKLTDDEVKQREQRASDLQRQKLRPERDARLVASDWTQLPDVPEATRKAWASYRQKLRDLPAKTKDHAKVDWPQPPA